MKVAVWVVAFAVLMVMPVSAPAASGLVYNPGFEKGDFSGWGTWGTTWTGSDAHYGSYAANSWIGAGGWQDISVFNPNTPLNVSGWLSDSDDDHLQGDSYAWFRLEFKDASDSIVGTWYSGKVYGSDLTVDRWKQFSTIITPSSLGDGIVKGTLVWESAGGSIGTGRFDDFQVNAVPEPVASLLFIAGGAVLVVRRLRRK